MTRPTASEIKRFWSHVRKTDTCWLYESAIERGYGRFRRWLNGNKRVTYVKAHRFAWVIAKGAIPAGLNVLHKCDTRNCVRQSHLFLGTQTMNHADMVRKGRGYWQRYGAKGEQHHRHVLTDQDVANIRRWFDEGESIASIHTSFPHVHRSTVNRAANRVHWTHRP